MSQENHPKPFEVLWEQLLGEDVSHLQGCFAENEENKALFHGLPHKMIVLGNVLSPFLSVSPSEIEIQAWLSS